MNSFIQKNTTANSELSSGTITHDNFQPRPQGLLLIQHGAGEWEDYGEDNCEGCKYLEDSCRLIVYPIVVWLGADQKQRGPIN